MQTLLAVDPGESIGYAIFNLEGSSPGILESGTILFSDLQDSILARKKFSRIVMESFPPIAPQRLSEISVAIMKIHENCDIAFISPGVYLPVTKNVLLPKKPSSIHEEEAIKLGLYFIKFILPKEKHE